MAPPVATSTALDNEQTLHNRGKEKEPPTKSPINLKTYKDEMQYKGAWRSILETPSLQLLAGHLVTWGTASIVLMIYTLFFHEKQAYRRGWADIWYGYGAFGFLVGLVFAFLGFQSAKNPEKKSLSLCLLGVNFISFTSYLLILLRLTPTMEGVLSNPVEPARYLEWISTCPILILLIDDITHSSRNSKWVVINDYVLCLTGFLGAVLTPRPFGDLFHWISCCSFSFVVYSLWKSFTDAIDGITNSKVEISALRWLRISTTFTWTAFPFAWFAYLSHLLTFTQIEAVFSMIDIGAKVFLTLVLVNNTVDQAQNIRVEQISKIAEDLEKEMGNTEAILEKMMPSDILEKLKQGKDTQAEEYECVSVFFSDIANFTVLSGRTPPKEMIKNLNRLWVEYDAIAKKWGIYKVETIGDAYLGVVGAPKRVPDHAKRCVNFALDIIEMVKNYRTTANESINIRVGINSGQITAGLLGDQNHWCIVGDTGAYLFFIFHFSFFIFFFIFLSIFCTSSFT
ncbi:Nitrogen permease regulator 2 [Coelomomyces lativittatus]|nr:Nitrogen permease regulator 2 [Coelomomyces lativittatus]